MDYKQIGKFEFEAIQTVREGLLFVTDRGCGVSEANGKVICCCGGRIRRTEGIAMSESHRGCVANDASGFVNKMGVEHPVVSTHWC